MKKSILIASYDLEIGGVERSLVSMLESFDYTRYEVDLLLYRHQGDFMNQLPSNVRVLKERPEYATIRKSIGQVFREKHPVLGVTRICARLAAEWTGKLKGFAEPGYVQLQYMWKYAMPFLPRVEKAYDVAISYLWPHDLVADKVNAGKKIAWIHTDYSTVETNRSIDLRMWDKYNHLIAVSDACRSAFIQKYGELSSKVEVMENIMSPDFIRSMAEEDADNPLIADARFKILTVARLSYAKGIDWAVQALKRLYDQGYKDVVWYVVGYGGDEAMLRHLIDQYGLQDRFILLGKKTNPYPYIKACDLYVQPSRYEGKAVTVTEAKVLGRPVLITNYATARSQVTDGTDGMITDLSVEGIAAGIETLYCDPELRSTLARHCELTDYSNRSELSKIYALAMAAGE